MSVPGSAPIGALMGKQAQLDPQQAYEQKVVRFMSSAMESCPAKVVMAGVMGAGLGGMFGMFMASMRYDTPLSPNAPEISSLPMRQQLKIGLRDMGRSSLSSARNFGIVGAVFSGTECVIESYRGKNDLANGIVGGCLTGSALAWKAGPQAMCFGCAGFAVFSAAIEAYMRMPSEGTGGRID